MAKQYAFYFNASACTGCKACQIACKDDNNLEVGIRWRRVAAVERGEWTRDGNVWQQNILSYNVSVSCNHCQNALCTTVCPTGAMEKREDGIVLLNQDACIGCRYCEWTCPYGAPQFDAAVGKMSKCDFCVENVDAGKAPACVAACPMRALDFGDLEELQAKYGTVDSVYPLPEGSVTQPAIVITPTSKATTANALDARIGNLEEI